MTQPDDANTILLVAHLLSVGHSRSAQDYAHDRGWIDAHGRATQNGVNALEAMKNHDGHGFFRAVA